MLFPQLIPNHNCTGFNDSSIFFYFKSMSDANDESNLLFKFLTLQTAGFKIGLLRPKLN